MKNIIFFLCLMFSTRPSCPMNNNDTDFFTTIYDDVQEFKVYHPFFLDESSDSEELCIKCWDALRNCNSCPLCEKCISANRLCICPDLFKENKIPDEELSEEEFNKKYILQTEKFKIFATDTTTGKLIPISNWRRTDN